LLNKTTLSAAINVAFGDNVCKRTSVEIINSTISRIECSLWAESGAQLTAALAFVLLEIFVGNQSAFGVHY